MIDPSEQHVFSARNSDFRNMLDTCGTAPDLTIFCGAGCSAEMGLPTWAPMLEQLVKFALVGRRGETMLDDCGTTLTDAVQDVVLATRGDPARLATFAGLIAGEENLLTVLRLALYGGLTELNPGPSLQQVAALYAARQAKGLTTNLVTTNYDEGLVVALHNQGIGHRGVTLRSLGDELEVFVEVAEDVPDVEDGPTIHHLHGVVVFDGEEVLEPVVLSESSYAMMGGLAVRELTRYLSSSTCLFVGLSLTDIDLIAAAYQTADHSREHFALQAEDLSIPPIAKRLHRERLLNIDIRPLRLLQTYSQVPQALYELRHRTELEGDYWTAPYGRYGSRLKMWAGEFENHYPARTPEESQDSQMRVSVALSDALKDLRRSLSLEAAGDAVALHLWLRRFDVLHLHLWASSEYVARTFGRLNYPTPLSLDGRLAVRQAFLGVRTPTLLPTPGSRWKQAVSVPIVTSEEDHRFGRLLVGVVNLSTDRPPGDSELAVMLREDPNAYDELLANLDLIGRGLLCDFNPLSAS